jgi:hypothetical protein
MIQHFGLEEFRTRRFVYRSGHHLAAYGPTQQAGKSTLIMALLEIVAIQLGIRSTVLCMKHSDKVVSHWTRRLNFVETPCWPPRPKLGHLHPPGHTLWPRQSITNVEADNALLKREFTQAILWNRTHVPSVTVADEIYGLIAELQLRTLLTAVITRDSGAGHGMWYASQKPSGTQGVSMPGFLFNSSQHMFLSNDGEKRNRVRYGEIACGIDPQAIEREVLRLAPFSWLYIRRGSPPFWCVVDAYDPGLAVAA